MNRWKGLTVAILASGPSMNAHVAADVRASGLRTIAINNTFELAPWADVLYACDGKWWNLYFKRARSQCAGEFWTQDERAAKQHSINFISSRASPGLSADAGLIHQGGNSGYQAIGLAHKFGAARILLFGFDMGAQTHWHGDHLPSLFEHMPFHEWLPRLQRLATDLKTEGVEVFNCSPRSNLDAFPFLEFGATEGIR